MPWPTGFHQRRKCQKFMCTANQAINSITDRGGSIIYRVYWVGVNFEKSNLAM